MADFTHRPRRRPTPVVPGARLILRTSVVDQDDAAGTVVVTAVGEIDLTSRAALATALAGPAADPGTRLLVGDLSRVTFLACAGVSVLLEAQAALVERGAALRLVVSEPMVRRVLAITGQHAPPVYADLAQALSRVHLATVEHLDRVRDTGGRRSTGRIR